MESRTKTLITKISALFLTVASITALAVTPAVVASSTPYIAAGSGVVVSEGQSLTVASNVSSPTLVRDSYTVIAPPKPEVTPAMVLDQSNPAFTNDVKWDIQWPFPVGVSISDGFGLREKPCNSCSANHKGQDFTPGNGSVPQAIYAGKVITVGNSGSEGYGYYVEIEHEIRGQKIITTYGHLQADSFKVAEGDIVKVGDAIGLVGSTGSSTGPHLHFGVQVNGVAVDPFIWLTANVGYYKQ